MFKDLASLKGLLQNNGYPHGKLIDEIQFRLSTQGSERMPPDSDAMTDEERLSLFKSNFW
jgi:hypothetical protein